MKLHKGVWFPSHEEHMITWCDQNGQMVGGRTSYQYKKLLAALGFVKQWRVAVDVGAHIGFFAWHLTKRFDHVHCFEPMAEHRECFERNVLDANRTLHPCALGSEAGKVALTVPQGSSGGTHISGLGDIPMFTLDSFNLQDVDFCKVDVEGAEMAVMQGAVETLKRCKPCVIIEQKSHTPGGKIHLAEGGKPAVDFLESLGYKTRAVISGDYILTCE